MTKSSQSGFIVIIGLLIGTLVLTMVVVNYLSNSPYLISTNSNKTQNIENEIDEIEEKYREQNDDLFDDTKTSKTCVISGCNGEICSSEGMNSICVFKEEFACYKTAICETQSNGNCGWTETVTLKSCLESGGI